MKGAFFGLIAGTVTGTVMGYMGRKHMERIERLESEIIELGMADAEHAWPIDPDDGTHIHPPQLAWVCDHCREVIIFRADDIATQDQLDELKQYDALICPVCDEENDIDDWTRQNILNAPPR